MGTRIHLYALPGLPLHVDDLMPQALLARCAGGLSAQGHCPVIFDEGSVERLNLAELAPCREALASRRRDGRPPLLARWTRHDDSPLAAFEGVRISRAMQDAPDHLAPAVCLIQVRRQKDVAGARLLARALRSRWPSGCIAIAGEFVDTYARALLSGANEFDVACVGPAESILPGLVRALLDTGEMDHIPGLVYRLGSRLAVGSLGMRPLDPDFAPATYHPSVYGGLLDGGKLKIFSLLHSTGLQHAGHYRGERLQQSVHVRDARQLRGEMVQLHELFGARVFHVTGEHTPREAIALLASEASTLPFDVAYSREAHIFEAGPAMAAPLVQSGCQAVGYPLLTGSQRLLSDFYGEDWTISQAEACLRAYRLQGCYIHTSFTYPCPADDYHTRAETIRLLRRCQPEGAHIEMPFLAPGSAWREYAADFGFDFCPKRLDRWVAGGAYAGGAVESTANLPFSAQGRTNKASAREMALLLSELPETGVPLAPNVATCLMARVSGRGMAFADEFLHALTDLDLAGLHDMIESFNARATASIATYDLHPALSIRKAVGN